MTTDFESNLRAQLESTPDLRRRGKRILAVLDARPSKRRTRRIYAMQQHAWAHMVMLGVQAQPAQDGSIDWSKIPWAKILQGLLAILLALLPFLI